jgi:hypothetical protein
MKLTWRWAPWLRAAAAALLLAGAIQAATAPTVTVSGDSFSASAVDPASAAQPQNGGGSGPPPGAGGGGGFASAAATAGFKPLTPGQALDLGAYKPVNPLPDGVPFISYRTLGGFLYESDMEPWTDPFETPKRRKHPKRVIPPAVLALDGTRVAVEGFMLPFDFKQDGTRHFGLLRSQVGCCFGLAPGLNEWVDVVMPDKPVLVYMDTPLVVIGTLHVKPLVEAGNTMGLYHLVAEKVEVAKIPELMK